MGRRFGESRARWIEWVSDLDGGLGFEKINCCISVLIIPEPEYKGPYVCPGVNKNTKRPICTKV
jgi:hypothetical protein